jgi:hypothetical protein
MSRRARRRARRVTRGDLVRRSRPTHALRRPRRRTPRERVSPLSAQPVHGAGSSRAWRARRGRIDHVPRGDDAGLRPRRKHVAAQGLLRPVRAQRGGAHARSTRSGGRPQRPRRRAHHVDRPARRCHRRRDRPARRGRRRHAAGRGRCPAPGSRRGRVPGHVRCPGGRGEVGPREPHERSGERPRPRGRRPLARRRRGPRRSRGAEGAPRARVGLGARRARDRRARGLLVPLALSRRSEGPRAAAPPPRCWSACSCRSRWSGTPSRPVEVGSNRRGRGSLVPVWCSSRPSRSVCSRGPRVGSRAGERGPTSRRP